MGDFIYSNNVGCFVFDAKGNVIDSKLYKTAERAREASKLLAEGKITPQEKELLDKHNLPILGIKAEGVKTITDPVLFAKANRYMIEHHRKELIENTMAITKDDLKQSVKKDILIIQAVNNIQEIDKLINTLVKRLREWYSYYLPEFSNAVTDNEKFAELVAKRGRYEILAELKIKDDMSMGKDMPDSDVRPMKALAEQVMSLAELRKTHEDYLDKVMKEIAPNVRAIAGSMIGAKLIAHAGSVKKLSQFPASTVQILGAEKALFRHMKTGAKPPKFGVIINHPFIAKASKGIKGKAARLLADKLSIAAKIDHFKGEFVGDKLKKQIEDKLK
jgi:nucleolar protein 56